MPPSRAVSAKADGGSEEPFPLSRPVEAGGATGGLVRSGRKEAWHAHPRIDAVIHRNRLSSLQGRYLMDPGKPPFEIGMKRRANAPGAGILVGRGPRPPRNLALFGNSGKRQTT